jgi:26S proteasome regulatory subunit N6
MAKAKTAKLVRALLDLSSLIPDSLSLQMKLCEDSIEWCKEENRTFLRQKLELKVAQLYLDTSKFHDAIAIIDNLLSEVKKLDDKQQLVEIQLLEAKVYYRLENIPRAKASLTAARSCSNSIYCPPVLQADID